MAIGEFVNFELGLNFRWSNNVDLVSPVRRCNVKVGFRSFYIGTHGRVVESSLC
jgi:hypothetical protein